MKDILRIAIAQINCTVGDLDNNAGKIIRYIREAKSLSADVVVFPELALTGYPPEDLLFKPKFIKDNLKKIKELSRSVKGIAAVVGFVDKKGPDLYNAAAIIYNSRIHGIYHKMFLPNYGVFDEKRYFKPGDNPAVFKFGKLVFGVNICEDIWQKGDPIKQQALAGADLIININASPYHAGKIREREGVIRRQAGSNRLFIIYANLVGGQDELVFDGQSMIVDNSGRVIKRAEAFEEDLLVADLNIPDRKARPAKKIAAIGYPAGPKCKPALLKREIKPLKPVPEVYRALLLGLHDYVAKNNFRKVVIGLSGGVDSSLVAALAVDALGRDNVTGVFMPSPYTSKASRIDTLRLADNLGIKLINIPIKRIYKVYLDILTPHFLKKDRDITEENLQARIRGNILMALSNKFGWLVLTTGNKSEMSTGYATLYGDMAGGFAVIKDVPKLLVYKLSIYRNSLKSSCSGLGSQKGFRAGRVIPARVLTREPTAELKNNQKDSDTLPPYGTLDRILKAYVEEDKDLTRITLPGSNKNTVFKVLNMVDKSEYKRRQSPPGIKITPKAFGRDRRMPITNKYKSY